MAALLDLDLVL